MNLERKHILPYLDNELVVGSEYYDFSAIVNGIKGEQLFLGATYFTDEHGEVDSFDFVRCKAAPAPIVPTHRRDNT